MIDKDEIKKKRLANQLLARILCDNGLILSDDVILEYVQKFVSAVCIDDVFKDNTKLVFCGEMPSCDEIHEYIINDMGIVDYRINLISNDFNPVVESSAKAVLPYGRINLAICTDNLEKYEVERLRLAKFARELFKTGVRLDTYERQYGDHKLFLLSNRRRINGK